MDLLAWKTRVMRAVAMELEGDRHWRRKLERGEAKVHLAVFVEPWLSWLLDGTKTIESRFSVRRGVPYERVDAGDVLLLKASSGPVVGICEVGRASYFDLETTPVAEIRTRYGEAIGADDDFWEWVQNARYVTLLEVREPRRLTPRTCPKKDRRGWVVLA